MNIASSVISKNAAPGNPQANVQNYFTTFAKVTTSSSLIGSDPQLLPLGNYGGLTKTMPPASASSPVIDAGSTPI